MEKDNNTEELILIEIKETLSNGPTHDSKPEPKVYRAPDGGWGWIVCFACFMVHVMIAGLVYSSGILFVELLEYFNRSKAETSWIVALPFLISDLIWLGYSMMYTTSVVSVSRYFDKRRAFATGIGVSGVGIGIFIFGPITKLLIDLYTWRGAILIEGALMLNCIACGMVYLPLKEWKSRKSRTIDIKADQNKELLQNDIRASSRNIQNTVCKPSIKSSMLGLLDFSIFKHKGACLFFVHWFLASMAYLIPYIYVPDYAKEVGVTGYQGAWLISTVGITNTIGRVMFGFISDQKNVNRLYIYIIAIITCGISTSLVPLLTTFELLVVYCAVFGMCSGAMMALLTVMMADIVGIDRLMDTFGFSGFFAGLAQFIGSPGAGWLFDVTGGYKLTFILYGIILAVSGSILFVVPCLKRDDTMTNGTDSKRQEQH